MPTAGALAAQGHFPSVGTLPAWMLVAVIGTIGEVCGATALYAAGYFGGMPFVHRWGKYVGFKEKELGHVQAFYRRFGKLTVFWCRFIPFVRGVASLPAGLSRMPYALFLAFTAIGSAIFCFGLAYLGQVAGKNLDTILPALHKAALLIIVVVVLAIAAGIVWWRTSAKKRAAAADDAAA